MQQELGPVPEEDNRSAVYHCTVAFSVVITILYSKCRIIAVVVSHPGVQRGAAQVN